MDRKKSGPVLAILIAGVLMGALDIAILSPALRSIQSGFGIDERALSWIISMYVLFSLIGTPIMSKLADTFGRRSVFALDLGLFGLGSLVVVASGFIHSWPLLLAGRAVQGFGGGGIFPVAASAIGDTVAPEKRGAALGALGAMFGAAFVVGPILGAILIPFGWQWLFLINVPISILLIALALRILPGKAPVASRSLDLPGILLLSAFLVSFSLSINSLDFSRGLAAFITGKFPWYLGAAAVFLVATILYERRSRSPLLPASLFSGKRLKLAYGIALATGIAESSMAFIPTLALAAHGATGLSPAESSYLLLPLVFAMSIFSPISGRLVDKVGPRPVMLVGSALLGLGFLGINQTWTTLWLMIAATVLVGIGMSALLGAPIRYLVLSETAEGERTVAQGLANMFASIGIALGAAIIGAVSASGGGGAHGYGLAFGAMAAVACVAFILSLGIGTTRVAT